MYTRYPIVVYMRRLDDKIKLKIKKVAKEYIFTYGIRGWNMNEFACEAGITKRTLYKYVKSKEALVESTLINYVSDIQSTLVSELKETADFHSGIMYIIEVYPSMIVKMNSRVINDIFLHYPAIEESVINKRKYFTKELTKYIQDAQQNNFITQNYDSQEIFEVIQSLIIYYSKYQPDLLEEKLKTSISMLIYGIIQR